MTAGTGGPPAPLAARPPPADSCRGIPGGRVPGSQVTCHSTGRHRARVRGWAPAHHTQLVRAPATTHTAGKGGHAGQHTPLSPPLLAATPAGRQPGLPSGLLPPHTASAAATGHSSSVQGGWGGGGSSPTRSHRCRRRGAAASRCRHHCRCRRQLGAGGQLPHPIKHVPEAGGLPRGPRQQPPLLSEPLRPRQGPGGEQRGWGGVRG